jgi:hypothetical protein
MAILGVAQRTGRRRAVVREVVLGLTGRGVYADSQEELLPWRQDWRTVVLPVAATVVTLVRPSLCSAFTDGAVSRYSLGPPGWRRLLAAPALEDVSAATA